MACGSLFVSRELFTVACRIQFPDQGLNLGPLDWECRVLATGPSGKSYSYCSYPCPCDLDLLMSPSYHNQDDHYSPSPGLLVLLNTYPAPHTTPTEPNYTERSLFFYLTTLILVSFSSTVVSQHTHTHILNLLGFVFRILGLCFCRFIKKDSQILFGICESQTL